MKKEEAIGAVAVIAVIAVVGYMIYKSVEAKEELAEGKDMREPTEREEIRTGRKAWLGVVSEKGGRAYATLKAIIALKRDRPYITEWIEKTVVFPRVTGDQDAYLGIIQRSGPTTPFLQWYYELREKFPIMKTKGINAIWRYGQTQDYTLWKRIEWAYKNGKIDGMPTTLEFKDPYYKQYFEWWNDVIKRGDTTITDALVKYIIDQADQDSLDLAIWHYTVGPILEEKQDATLKRMFPGQDVHALDTSQLSLWMKQWARKWSRDAVVAYLSSLGYSQAYIDKAIADSGIRFALAADMAKAKKTGGQYGINPKTGKPYTAQEYYSQVYVKQIQGAVGPPRGRK